MVPIAKPQIDQKEIKAVTEVLKSGMIVQGKKVEELEKNFSKISQTKYAIAVNSGTAALHLALIVAGVKPGDEVITTGFSFLATANTIMQVGAIPVFVDITFDDYNIDASLIEKAITKKTKAILPVHLYGQPADMAYINHIADKYDLIVIEDACQAHAATYKKHAAGDLGHIACFSLYATKNMTSSEGGIITTNSKKAADTLKMLRSHGQSKKYHSQILGYNYRMTDIEAAIGIEQLKKLKKMNTQRQKNAKFLTKNLKDIEGIETPQIMDERTHVFHQYTIRITDEFKLSRDKLAKYLLEQGIQTDVHYPLPINEQEHIIEAFGHNHLPNAHLAAKTILSLPVHPGLSEKDLNKICKVIQSV